MKAHASARHHTIISSMVKGETGEEPQSASLSAFPTLRCPFNFPWALMVRMWLMQERCLSGTAVWQPDLATERIRDMLAGFVYTSSVIHWALLRETQQSGLRPGSL